MKQARCPPHKITTFLWSGHLVRFVKLFISNRKFLDIATTKAIKLLSIAQIIDVLGYYLLPSALSYNYCPK